MTVPEQQTECDARAERLDALARHSVRVIEANQAPTGAYVASPRFPVYRYSWFRDGAFIADAMSRAGRTASAEAFFAWGARILRDRRGQIEAQIAARAAGRAVDPTELLHCRYTVDGAEAAEEWWNFQLDGYGTWLWAIDQHARRGRFVPDAEAARLCVRYLAAFWSEPSYDWWEEHMGHLHTSTLAALYGGLAAASGWAVLDGSTRVAAERAAGAIADAVRTRGTDGGRFTKWLGGDGLDASLVALATPFRLVEPGDPLMAATVAAIERELAAGGGVHRHPADSYFGGGEWLLLAALLGWHHAESGRTEDAWARLEWIAAQATDEGDLPEQVGTRLLFPDAREGWEQRWGPVATPLLWSHAMFLTLALELGAVERRALAG